MLISLLHHPTSSQVYSAESPCGKILDVREGSVGEHGLGDDSREGEHSKAAVLELADLHALDLIVGLSLEDVKGVEPEVTGLRRAKGVEEDIAIGD